MAPGLESSLAYCLIDHLLRRWGLPLTLLAASLLRYNVFSFIYLLFFAVSVVIPSPRLKKQRISCIVYAAIVLVTSLLFILAQVGFQVAIATGFTLDSCETLEVILRQVGLILFIDKPAIDIVRHILPDVTVFIVTTITLGVAIKVGRLQAPPTNEHQGETNEHQGETNEGDSSLLTRQTSSEQGYIKLPSWFPTIIDVLIFSLLLLCSVTVPSLTSLLYYLVFLIITILWSFHLKLISLIRVIRFICLIYSVCHILLLYIYQFQSTQLVIPVMPQDTATSLLARLFGLTPLIQTKCSRPTELIVWDDTPTSYYINPWVLIGLYWILGLECQLWLTTPKTFWSKHQTYAIPTLPYMGGSTISQSSGVPVQYGSTEATPIIEESDDTEATPPKVIETSLSDEPTEDTSVEPKNKKSVQDLWTRFTDIVMELVAIVMSVNYTFSLIAMMAWSVLYPSWLAFVLLLWACFIWLIPRVNPKKSFYWTSPFLLLYSIALLFIQFVHSLDLRSDELNWNVAIGTECRESPHLHWCRSLVLFIKSLFMLVFCATVHEFIKELKIMQPPDNQRLTNVRTNDTGDVPLLGLVSEDSRPGRGTVTLLYIQLRLILITYWILAVVGAFMLVILAGNPSVLKSVYIVFFFILLILYQTCKKWWSYINLPLWCILIVYATLHLIAVYTFPFPVINNLWMMAYDSSRITNVMNISSEDLFESIGFIRYSTYGTSSLSLFAVLIPLALFVAILALQIRYFTYSIPSDDTDPADSDTLSIRGFVSRLVNVERKNITEQSLPAPVQGEDSEDSSGTESRKITLYRVIVYLLVKLRELFVSLWFLFWRFSQLHVHKFVMIALFAVSISEVSTGYLLVVLFVLVATPFPVLNYISYPLVTAYLGLLTLAKFLFQIKLIDAFDFNCLNFYDESMINYTYSSDSVWIGLNKVDNISLYIAGPMVVSLLLSFWFSINRYQKHHYEISDIHVNRWEIGSLFLGVELEQVHQSGIEAIKYLINHTFEMYGIEICWIMQAILIAIRIDIYGVLYAVILGAMLFFPRNYLRIAWFFIVIFQGLALIVQYGMVLGLPPGILCGNVYPWNHTLSTYQFRLNRWLYLPTHETQVLNKTLLFADVISYILLCQQMKCFIINPLYSMRRYSQSIIPNMYRLAYWVDYLKILMFQFYFWLVLFIVFIAAAVGLNIFGLFYLVFCFMFIYRGQSLLTDTRRTREKWWSLLLVVTYIVLLIHSMIQLVGCVFTEDFSLPNEQDVCIVVSLFDLHCPQEDYYNITSTRRCYNGTQTSAGLWLYAVSFALITIQTILLNTNYADQVEKEIINRMNIAVNFAEIMQKVLLGNKEKAEQKQKKALEELDERTEQLQLTESKVSHLLNAGTYVPSQYIVQSHKKKSITPSPSHSEHSFKSPPTDPPLEEEPFDVPTISDDDVDVKSKDVGDAEAEIGNIKRVGVYLWGVWLEVVDYIIKWMESNSADYIKVVRRLHAQSGTDALAETTPSSQAKPANIEATPIVPEPVDKTSDSHQFDQSDVIVTSVMPTAIEVEDARMIESKLDEISSMYTHRAKKLMYATYYWFLSHFEFVVFFLVILVVLRTGSLISLIYAAVVFVWGLLSIPWPSKRFWLTLLFLTMIVLVIKYIYHFVLVTGGVNDNHVTNSIFSWIFGIQYRSSYVENAVFNLLLLMSIIFHRGLMKQHGLWHDSGTNRKGQNILKEILKNIRNFFKNLISSNINAGRKDYYIFILTCDVLCFLTLAFGYSQFTVTTDNGDIRQVATFIQTNHVPLTFLILLFIQFISMLIDRAIYLRHSLRAKFIYYIILLVGWHIGLLILLPIITNRGFTSTPAAQFFYFFKSGYFIFSALQMISGYPKRLLGYFLSSNYSTIVGLIFMGYRLIPIIPELREVMDWWFTDTSLSLTNWLRVQEIWATVYKIKVQREEEKSFPRDLGEKESSLIKLLLGILLIGALVLLIWGPLFAISFVNQASEPNPPLFASIQLNLEGFQLLEIQAPDAFIYELSSSEFDELRDNINSNDPASATIKARFNSLFYINNFRRILFPGNASLFWSVNQPSQNQLKSLLQTKDVYNLEVSWALRRSPHTQLAAQRITGSFTTSITNKTIQQQFLNNLNGNITPIKLVNIYPTFVTGPANSMSSNYTDLSRYITGGGSVTCIAQLNETRINNVTINQWWTLTQSSSYQIGNNENEDLEMIIHSEAVAPPIFSFISSTGVIGLYVSVVLVISKFVRSYVNSLAQNLVVEEMLYPDRILRLCDDIYMAREAKKLVLEEILVGRLIYIFRKSSVLLEITKLPKIKTD